MIPDRSDENPFNLFRQFPELKVGLFVRKDRSSANECAALLGFDKVAALWQEHSTVIHVTDKTLDDETKGDGIITITHNLALAIRFADCQAFVIYEPKKKVLGVLHAGWRGMAAKAITSIYDKLKEEFDVKPEETFIGAAPSLCKNCAEFSDPKNELPEHMHQFIDETNVDLQKAADSELISLGVPESQIERHPTCTRCEEGFWSWRRDKKEDARNYLVAGLFF